MFTWTPEMIRLMQNANALRRGVRAGQPLGSAEPVF